MVRGGPSDAVAKAAARRLLAKHIPGTRTDLRLSSDSLTNTNMSTNTHNDEYQ